MGTRGFVEKTYATRFGPLVLPDIRDPDITDKLRITWHWSAGSYGVSSRSLEHYHILGEKTGRLVQGVPVALQIVSKDYPRDPGYAKHVRNANSNNIAISAMAMAESHEHRARQGEYGPYPLTAEQVEFLAEGAAWVCYVYGIPVIPTRVLGHAEWRTVMGIHQDRWDVCAIPHLDMRPEELPDGTFTTHNYLRGRTKARVGELARAAAQVPSGAGVEAIAAINGHLGKLYELTDTLPLSLDEVQAAKAGLNQFNRVLLNSGLKRRIIG